MIKEVWKDIKGYEGYYKISSLGRVMSITPYFKKGKHLLTPYLNKKRGYYYVSTQIGGKYKYRKNWALHRLVAENFIIRDDNKLEVNHKDGNKLNNKVNNLEWVTKSENSKHAFRNGLIPRPKGKRKIDEITVLKIRMTKQENPNLLHRKIAKMFGLATSTITHILLGTRWGNLPLNFDTRSFYEQIIEEYSVPSGITSAWEVRGGR